MTLYEVFCPWQGLGNITLSSSFVKSFPLISCVCVTRNRPNLLQNVIACFLSQTYPNKELVIVYEDDDVATKVFLKQQRMPEISIFEVASASKLTLGALRNFSISK